MTYITPEQLARAAIRSMAPPFKALTPDDRMAIAAHKIPVQDPARRRSGIDEFARDYTNEMDRAEAPSYITPEQSAKSAIRSLELTLKTEMNKPRITRMVSNIP